MAHNVPQLSDGRISPVTKALDKYTILFRFFKLCSYAPVAKLVLWAAKPSSSLSTSYYPLCSASSAIPVYASFANQIIALFSTNSLFIFPFFNSEFLICDIRTNPFIFNRRVWFLRHSIRIEWFINQTLFNRFFKNDFYFFISVRLALEKPEQRSAGGC